MDCTECDETGEAEDFGLPEPDSAVAAFTGEEAEALRDALQQHCEEAISGDEYAATRALLQSVLDTVLSVAEPLPCEDHRDDGRGLCRTCRAPL